MPTYMLYAYYMCFFLYMLKIQLILVYDKDGYLLDLKDVVKL